MANIPSTRGRTGLAGPSSGDAAGPSNQYATGPSSQYVTGPSSQYTTGPISQYATGPSSQHVVGSSSQGVVGPSIESEVGPSSQGVVGSHRESAAGPSGARVAGPRRARAARPSGARAARPSGARAARPSGARAARPSRARAEGPSIASAAGPSIASAAGPSIASAAGPSIASAGGPSIASAGGPSIASAGGPSIASAAGPSIASAAGPSIASAAGPSIASAAGPSIASAAGPSIASAAGPSRARPAGPSRARPAGPSRARAAQPRNQRGNRTQRRAAANPYRPTYLSPGDVCMVCGDEPTGSHYKTMTCEGCKGFFRRVVQHFKRGPPDFICKKDQNCVITKETRNNCRYCRYKKCIEAKMDTQYVQDEATRQKENEKKQRKQELTKAKELMEITDKDLDHLRQIGDFYKCQNVLDCFWYPTEPSNPNAQLQEALVAHAYNFVRNIPGVSKIHREDFFVLIKHRLIDVLALQLSEVFDRKKESLNFCNAQITENDTLENESLKHIFNYAKHHSQFCTSDGITLGLLCAITFLNGETLDLKEPVHIKTALEHIMSVAIKHLRTTGQWRLSKLIFALRDFEYIQEDKHRLIWKITGMREEDSEVERLILNDPPAGPIELDEQDEENRLGESEASDVLNNATLPSAIIKPRAIVPPSVSPNALVAALNTIIPSSTTAPCTFSLSTFVTPSTSVISSACTTPGSTDMATNKNEDIYECSSIKQENDILRHQYQQSTHYLDAPPYWSPVSPRHQMKFQQPTHYLDAPYWGSVSPRHQMKFQQPSGNSSQHQELSPPNVGFRDRRYMPYTHGQNLSPLSSSSSSSGHSESLWSGMADSSFRAASETLGTTNNEAQYGLDLSLHGRNQRSDDHRPSLYRTPQLGFGWQESNNPQSYTRNPLSPAAVGVPGTHSSQNQSPNVQVNITTAKTADIISLAECFVKLSKEVYDLRGEVELSKVIKQTDALRSGSSESKLESTLPECPSTHSSLSELASSPYFSPLYHPEIEHALSTRQLSYVTITPRHMRYQFPQLSPPAHGSPRHPLICSPDMPENINQLQRNTFQSVRPMNDQLRSHHYFQTVGYEKPIGHASLKPGNSSALQEEQVYQTSDNFNRLQNYQHNSAFNYPSAPSESLSLPAAHSTAGEASSADSSVLARTLCSREPETKSLPVKKQLKKKWLHAHLTGAE